nr:MoxR family ATPase [Saprospiraceae bacterium]
EFPSLEKEKKIIAKRLPDIEESLLNQVVSYVQKFRSKSLSKLPGVSESIDWAESLMALGYREVNAKAFRETLGVLLKSKDDIKLIKEEV